MQNSDVPNPEQRDQATSSSEHNPPTAPTEPTESNGTKPHGDSQREPTQEGRRPQHSHRSNDSRYINLWTNQDNCCRERQGNDASNHSSRKPLARSFQTHSVAQKPVTKQSFGKQDHTIGEAPWYQTRSIQRMYLGIEGICHSATRDWT